MGIKSVTPTMPKKLVTVGFIPIQIITDGFGHAIVGDDELILLRPWTHILIIARRST